ncbi:hypothetical protein C9439_04230 [archaeon SCG-AAA382B04]|nr:hypothetical protein C9439_04230 [archaeon SCG-AAA382B04]
MVVKMESRKVYKSGGSTYIMSIPIDWVRELSLEEGDSVFLSKHQNSVTLYPEDREEENKVKIDTTKIPSYDSLLKFVIAHYLKGAKTIEILFDDERDPEIKRKLNKVLDNLVGIEIVEDIGEKITLEIFIDYERMKTPTVLDRIKNIISSMLEDLEKGIKFENQEMIKESLKREESVDRLYFLILRELNYAITFQAVQENLDIKNPGDVLSYKTIVKSYERISDHIEDICSDYIELIEISEEIDFSEQIIDLLNQLKAILEKAWNSRNENNLESFDRVFKEIREFNSKYDLIHEEIFEKTRSQKEVIKYTDIMISLSRIAQYISDMMEGEVNLNTNNFQ